MKIIINLIYYIICKHIYHELLSNNMKKQLEQNVIRIQLVQEIKCKHTRENLFIRNYLLTI